MLKNSSSHVSLFSFAVSERIPSARLNGGIVEDFTVSSLTDSTWEISLKPAGCVVNLPLLRLHDLNATIETSTKLVYDVAAITIEKTQLTSPPVTGTFRVLHNQTVWKGMLK